MPQGCGFADACTRRVLAAVAVRGMVPVARAHRRADRSDHRRGDRRDGQDASCGLRGPALARGNRLLHSDPPNRPRRHAGGARGRFKSMARGSPRVSARDCVAIPIDRDRVPMEHFSGNGSIGPARSARVTGISTIRPDEQVGGDATKRTARRTAKRG